MRQLFSLTHRIAIRSLWLVGLLTGLTVSSAHPVDAGASSAKAFTIPHPLDPEHKVLRHFCMEGPEVWNVYAGNAQIRNGQAVIDLPAYYAALNKPGSEVVTLTPWGPANVWVQRVEGHTLSIGGDADVKVSWTVKTLRNDPACREDLKRRPVEQLRSELPAGRPDAENIQLNTGPAN